MKTLHVPLTPELHRQLKILAALRETTVAAFVRATLVGAMEPPAQEQIPRMPTMQSPPLVTR